ncbi:AMIN domain-containing protein [Geotalea uraniireducens]|uniref:AMIN domain-containing protein n=1 Tax=Geotalea uraniireducens (strain Rf4) TaxID=351605 RepID=A5G5C8_GEOUR|nr:AMIN domain-containing protein [Geotalea uraniireducens]ABQ26996.1 hypothetical protein Gura_2823 [Geotalea uraniireducens Rf4]
MQKLKILTVILTMFLTVPGFSIVASAEPVQPVLQKIQVTGTGKDTRIDIVADKPLTYTYYKMPDLLKVVIDLALVDPGSVAPVTVNSGLISKITVEKKAISNFSLTRVVINLKNDAEFAVLTDQADKGKIQVSFGKTSPSTNREISKKTGVDKAKTEGDAATIDKTPLSSVAITTQPAAIIATAPAAEAVLHQPVAAVPALTGKEQQSDGENATTDKSAVVIAETKTGQAASLQRTESATFRSKAVLLPVVPQKIPSGPISAVKVNKDNLVIVTGSGVADYNAFTLTNPGRLVIDLPLAKCSILAKDMPVKRFGIAKARVGTYPDKVRLVFDAAGKTFPAYKIEKTGKGLKVTFPALKKG